MQAGSGERRIRAQSAPQVDDTTARIERRAQGTLGGGTLRGGEVFVRELPRNSAAECLAHLERCLARVIVAGMDLYQQGSSMSAADDRRARRSIQAGINQSARQRAAGCIQEARK